MNRDTHEMLNRLSGLGITTDDTLALRRVAMTLHRWHELESGTDHACVERDEDTGRTYWLSSYSGKRWPTPDRERGALRRLKEIMARYPTLSAHVQGDPRGASLYILKPGDVPAGCDVESYYSRGTAVYK